MPLRRFFSSARDKRTLLYCLSLLLDILCLFAGYIVALQLRDEQWLAAGGHSIIYIALPIFIMFEIAREAQDVETLANRLKIGRASCREGVCQYVSISVVAVSLKKKKKS